MLKLSAANFPTHPLWSLRSQLFQAIIFTFATFFGSIQFGCPRFQTELWALSPWWKHCLFQEPLTLLRRVAHFAQGCQQTHWLTQKRPWAVPSRLPLSLRKPLTMVMVAGVRQQNLKSIGPHTGLMPSLVTPCRPLLSPPARRCLLQRSHQVPIQLCQHLQRWGQDCLPLWPQHSRRPLNQGARSVSNVLVGYRLDTGST